MDTVTVCTGACCAAFTLPAYTPTEIAWRISRPDYFEMVTVAPMLIPLTPDEHTARLIRFGYYKPTADGRPGVGMWPRPDTKSYTCRHWDEVTRLCTIYDRRPGMCSGYPYDGRCGACGGVYQGSTLVQIGQAYELPPPVAE